MRCPNCGSTDSVEVDSIAFSTIWRALESDFDSTFKVDIIQAHTPDDLTVLHDCADCRIQFFAPAVAGNQSFYRSLSSSQKRSYYEDRWEFAVVGNQLMPGQKVLDIGAGPGIFLEVARKRGCVVIAVDHNRSVLASLRSRRIEAYSSMQALREAGPHTVDVVCAFHILEHVEDIAGFVDDALLPLRVGGTLNLAVPNRTRSGRAGFEPLDTPPHHLSRWSCEALRQLAENRAISVPRMRFEPPDPSSARHSARVGVVIGS